MIGDLAPRKGHFSLSPWQRHGKTVPQKEYALVGFEGSKDEAYSQTPGGRGCGSPSHTTRALALSQSNRFVNKPATGSSRLN